MLDQPTNALLSSFHEGQIECWLDSGTLLGVCRDGQPPYWDKDCDLGLWLEDAETIRAIVWQFASEWGFSVVEKWLDGKPYAFILKPNWTFMMRPDGLWVRKKVIPIAVHLYSKKEHFATSPQPHNLLSSAQYPMVKSGLSRPASVRPEREDLRGRSIREWLQMMLVLFFHFPVFRHIVLLSIRKLGRGKNGVAQKHPMEYRLFRVFFERFEWAVPIRYFTELGALPGAPAFIKVPNDYDSYLTERYGDWRTPQRDWNYTLDDGLLRKEKGS